MTINNKIVTSVAASAVLAGSLFAATGSGTLKYNDGSTNVVIAEELYQLSGEVNATVSSVSDYWVYTADLDGSGTVSDAAFNLTFSNAIVRTATIDTFYIVDLADGNKTVAKEIAYDANSNQIKFDSDSAWTISNGKEYAIVPVNDDTIALGDPINPATDVTQNIKVLGDAAAHKALTATLDVWSTSGTEELRDTAVLDIYDVVPQYSVACENKIDNLINVENSSNTFVATKHGATLDGTGANGDVSNVVRDILSFTVTKTAVDIGLDGNASVLNIVADNNTTFTTLLGDAASAVTHDFGAEGTDVNPAALTNGYSDVNITDQETSTSFSGLDASTDTFTVAFDVNGSSDIPVTNFTANFYINDSNLNGGDSNTTYTPAGTYTADAAIGNWAKFAYIAQVAGATETSATRSKFFITNRSCATVTPKMTLIQGGNTVTFDLDELAVDTQMKVTLESAIAANEATITAAGLPTTGQFSVELTMAGNAEDFYVYAQAQSKTDIAATKDLPVYNTSTRD